MYRAILIIPCFNEFHRLKVESFIDWSKDHPDILLYFVNDGSSDATLSLLLEMKEKSATIDYLDLKKNVGKGSAVRLGLLEALKRECRYLGYWDADLATPLSEISPMLQLCLFQKKEVVFGTRLARMGAKIHRTLFRHYVGRFFATLVSLLLGLVVYDTQCGAKFFKKSLIKPLFSRPFLSPWLFDVEILFRLKNLHFSFEQLAYEYPLHFWAEISGSKVRWSYFMKAPWELLKIYLYYQKRADHYGLEREESVREQERKRSFLD